MVRAPQGRPWKGLPEVWLLTCTIRPPFQPWRWAYWLARCAKRGRMLRCSHHWPTMLCLCNGNEERSSSTIGSEGCTFRAGTCCVLCVIEHELPTCAGSRDRTGACCVKPRVPLSVNRTYLSSLPTCVISRQSSRWAVWLPPKTFRCSWAALCSTCPK